ncbi:hypothetical protein [Flexithrix dorotheae]|uniref:hypothetical protein n=1 Tax=Flexithrix dorotheae TaxID=70993 RepID=UPI000381487A|nr:hypothetical protein [Flexithrix dorotheae]
MKKFLLLFIVLPSLSILCYSQSANIPLNQDYYHLIDRYEIKQKRFSKSFETAIKPFNRKGVAVFLDSLPVEVFNNGSSSDKFNLEYLLNDNWDWTTNENNESKKRFLKALYKKKSDFYAVDEKDFNLHVNPVIYVSMGSDKDLDKLTYTNTRGVDIRGSIGKKLGFYTFLADNQIRFPSYVNNEISKRGAIPGEGFWKPFGENETDFFTARGYIQFSAIKDIIGIQFGHDKNFIGNGYRSLVLSDYSNNYLFLKLNTRIWKINYTNIFSSMMAAGQRADNGPQQPFPKKYNAFHRLGINITDNFNIGLFENVTFGVQDSLGNQFDVNYLNPIIFYRAVEHDTGDYGNAFVGLDYKWNLWHSIQWYGQFVLDELIVSELFSNSGWWGNKFGVQTGIKYIDVAKIKNLDLQAELNLVRPYTFTHYGDEKYSNYQHYDQALAHPLGANFYELIGIIRYQPFPKLSLTAKGIYVKIGKDRQGENWGHNIFLNYDTRMQEYNNKIGQGLDTRILFVDFTLSYQFKHNFFIDLKNVIRKETINEEPGLNTNTNFINMSLRWNIAQRLNEF